MQHFILFLEFLLKVSLSGNRSQLHSVSVQVLLRTVLSVQEIDLHSERKIFILVITFFDHHDGPSGQKSSSQMTTMIT